MLIGYLLSGAPQERELRLVVKWAASRNHPVPFVGIWVLATFAISRCESKHLLCT
jgi:hypothetical protein